MSEIHTVYIDINDEIQGFDMESVIRHEIGHVLGLGHVVMAGSDALMTGDGLPCGTVHPGIDNHTKSALRKLYGFASGERQYGVQMADAQRLGGLRLRRIEYTGAWNRPNPGDLASDNVRVDRTLTYELQIDTTADSSATFAMLRDEDWVDNEFTYYFSQSWPMARIHLNVYDNSELVGAAVSQYRINIPVADFGVLPDDLLIFSGVEGGPFATDTTAYTLRNRTAEPLQWAAGD